MVLSGLRPFGAPKWPCHSEETHQNDQPVELVPQKSHRSGKHLEMSLQNHTKVEKHSKMVGTWSQNHFNIATKSLKNNEFAENTKMPPRACLQAPERLGPIKNGAKK